MVEKIETKEYRLTGKGFTKKVRKENQTYSKGELVPLTASQYEAFKDQFEEEDAAEKKLVAQKAADVQAKKEKADSEAALEDRKKELEERGKENSDASEEGKGEGNNTGTEKNETVDEGKDEKPETTEAPKTNPLAKAAAAVVGKVAGGAN